MAHSSQWCSSAALFLVRVEGRRAPLEVPYELHHGVFAKIAFKFGVKPQIFQGSSQCIVDVFPCVVIVSLGAQSRDILPIHPHLCGADGTKPLFV